MARRVAAPTPCTLAPVPRPLAPPTLVLALALAPASSACHAGGDSRSPRSGSTAATGSTETSEATRATEAFQAEYDAELRASTHSFLTAVDAFYLDAGGEPLVLALDDDGWREDAAGTATFENHGDTLTATIADGEPTVVDAYSLVPVGDAGRWTLQLSPQGEGTWRVLVHDAQAEARARFAGLQWFPIRPELIVDATYVPTPERTPSELATSRGEAKTLYAAARLEFELAGQALTLTAYGYAATAEPDEPLLIPFRDQTTGRESYGAGRYLELHAPADGDAAVTLDFNRATNPLCAYSPHYNCPIPPRHNDLPVAIEGGARAPAEH